MQSQCSPRTVFALRKVVAVGMGLGMHLALAWNACGALESGVYQTLPGLMVEERWDLGPNGGRMVPLSATFTFDLSGAQPTLTAVMPNAVLEREDPIALTVRSLTSGRLGDGTYWFRGDYLGELYPQGTQYMFDWRFSTAANGDVVWNGNIGWSGGRYWMVTINDAPLQPVPEPSVLALLGAGTMLLCACRTFRKLKPGKISPASVCAS